MIDYLIKSGLCLLILLVLYHLFLEKEKMHRFNRFFLLFSLVFGLLTPLITVEVSNPTVLFAQPISEKDFTDQVSVAIQEAHQASVILASAEFSWDMRSWFIFIYGLGTGILLTRFAGNLLRILSRISKHSKLSLENATLILLPGEVLPHSFLNYIFINEDDYRSNRVEDQLFIHELTHVRQMHSLDILFVEILKIIFWFNPIFMLYKKAIQLNHEFLADEAVVKSNDISAYQFLLLEKSISKNTIQLASNLNFSVTKKRLKMMTKTTSRATSWFTKLAVLPLMTIVFVLFCNMTESIKKAPVSISKIIQTKPVNKNTTAQNKETPKWPSMLIRNFPSSNVPASQEVLNQYSALADKYVTDYLNRKPTVTITDKSKMETLFRQMNFDQQNEQRIIFTNNISKPFQLLVPTKAVFESWKDPEVYGVWINEKYVRNEELNKYKVSDFSHYGKSNLYYTEEMKKNVMKRFNLTVMYKYQLGLMTNDYYEKYNVRIRRNMGKSRMWYVSPKNRNGLQMMKSEDII